MSQQVTKEKYSIETLRERNVSYDHQHWLTQEDVDMANSYVELIERTRSKITPQIGDRLVYVTEHGDYYGNALIDSRSAKEGYLSVCEQPYVPFVWEEDGNIRLSVSQCWWSYETFRSLSVSILYFSFVTCCDITIYF